MSDESASDEGHEPEPAPDQNPLRRTLDLFVFAPVGVALTVLEDLPGLVSKGRQRVEQEISNARVVGQFVVGQGQRELGDRLNGLLGRSPTESDQDPGGPTGEPSESVAPSAPTAPAAPPSSAPRPAPDPADEAIVEQALSGYDTLSASQVVRRLESLGPDQLKAVQRHEASHRNRRTILNRTTQLLDEGGATTASISEAE